MYIRFTVTELDLDSHKEQGLFVKSYQLLKSGDLNEGEIADLKAILKWFEDELPIPKNEEIRNENTGRRAVFWYRSSARECIGRMWELANALRSHGHAIEIKTCLYFGNVAYIDKYQVAVYPHPNDGPIITK